MMVIYSGHLDSVDYCRFGRSAWVELYIRGSISVLFIVGIGRFLGKSGNGRNLKCWDEMSTRAQQATREHSGWRFGPESLRRMSWHLIF